MGVRRQGRHPAKVEDSSAIRGTGGGKRRKDGRGERIRTSDPLVPNQVLYQAEPLPEIAANCPHEHLKVYQITA
jgi:hypothetical protein